MFLNLGGPGGIWRCGSQYVRDCFGIAMCITRLTWRLDRYVRRMQSAIVAVVFFFLNKRKINQVFRKTNRKSERPLVPI